MRAILDEATDKWGIKVNRVELKNIMPPKDIQIAMDYPCVYYRITYIYRISNYITC